LILEGWGFSKSQTFPLEIKGLDIGDVDGDKRNEIDHDGSAYPLYL